MTISVVPLRDPAPTRRQSSKRFYQCDFAFCKYALHVVIGTRRLYFHTCSFISVVGDVCHLAVRVLATFFELLRVFPPHGVSLGEPVVNLASLHSSVICCMMEI